MLHPLWRAAFGRLANPLTRKERKSVPLGRDWRLEDRLVPAKIHVPAIPTLSAPAMPGLTSMDLALVGAIQRAWQVAPGTTTSEWVVGLAPGQTPQSLGSIGAQVEPLPILPGSYALTFASPQDIATFGPQLAAQVGYAFPLTPRPNVTKFIPNDSLFPQQWHLRNIGQTGGFVGEDAHVVGPWNNYTGSGVVIGVVDDGVEHTHPDLQPNYDAADSYDFNSNDSDPSPGGGDDHGTAVAGVAAAKGNNNLGVAGSAFNASIAGIRLLGAGFTDNDESNALSYHKDAIDIYNNSWGPADIGTLGSIGPLAYSALQTGYSTGRSGLGTVFTWAAGNGLGFDDNVNYDPYANSRFVIAVGAINHRGDQATYSEPGAPMLVTAYSSSSGAPGITTTDINNGYRNDFGGTSSATPLVSGVIALMLEANPNLTIRDIQNILVRTARKNDPTDAGWSTNAAGYHINHKYGFGAIDANAAVNLAKTWTTVAPQKQFVGPLINVNRPIPENNAVGVSSSFTLTQNYRLEHVEVVFNATHPYRGDLEVVLTSPSGTKSVLSTQHFTDDGDNYSNWVFSTVRHWGEQSAGVWKLTVRDKAAQDIGTFGSWQLRVYGIDVPPSVGGIETTTLPYLENSSVFVTNTLTVGAAAGGGISGARVSITGNFSGAEDNLTLTNPNGLQGIYDSGTGVLTISGNGSAATYQAALRSVKFSSSSENPPAITKSISFVVTDANGNASNPATRKVAMIAVNDAPSFTLQGPSIVVDEDSGEQLFFDWATNISPGPPEESGQTARIETVSYDNPDLFTFPPFVDQFGTLKFISAPNAFGTSTVRIRARDNGGTANGGIDFSGTQSFTITVINVNDAPIPKDDRFVVSEEKFLTVNAPGVLGNDQDMEGDAITAVKLSNPTHGVLSFNANGSFTYQPNPNFVGNDTFTYEATDGSLTSTPATVTISVAPVNDAPVAVDDVASSDGHPVTINVVANDTDPDGDFLRVGTYTRPTLGSVTRLGNSLVYTPLPGAVGNDTFNYTVSDGNGGFDTGTVTVNVTDAIDPVVQGVKLTYGTGTTSVIDLASLTRSTLPWANISKFQFTFSENVNVTQPALTLTGGDGATLNFNYNAATRTATWSRTTGLPIDQYSLQLAAASVTDMSGNSLTANWAKSFAVLPGDFDGNGVVEDVDLTGIQANFSQPGRILNRFADVNGNGVVDATDLEIARTNKGKRA
jgi:VCBS repeat-containing protein